MTGSFLPSLHMLEGHVVDCINKCGIIVLDSSLNKAVSAFFSCVCSLFYKRGGAENLPKLKVSKERL